MNRILLLCLCFFISINAKSQQALSDLASIQEDGQWVEMRADVDVTPQAFLSTYKYDIGLTATDDFTSVKTESDNLGFTHHKFNHKNRGVVVEGSQYIVHTQGGKIIRSNGKPVLNITAPNEPLVQSQEAIDLAMLFMDADEFYWESESREALIKRIKQDEDATFYPTPELVFADPNYSQEGENYRLAWKIDLYAEGPKGHKTIFVDARDGHILYDLEECHDIAVEGVCETRYHGTQTFTTDSVAPGEYRLQDHSRMASIETYNMRTLGADFVPDSAVDFVDDDNFWDHHNAEADDAAHDVHWGMQETFDYFFDNHGRLSYDGNGAPIISYVHVRDRWFNARWTGMWAEFGDGNGDPLTSIDIVSHELTHGVTRNSSNLVYRNESGALNESFSDIFGVAVEWQALPNEADWFMGLLDFQLRDISDPNDMNDPDTYGGSFWQTDPDFDNGGVHTNSGVQNYWYYLLAMGGSGTNDNNDVYELEGIGMEKAEAIAYRNLTTYLTVSSTFQDARYGAILSAEDLYGPCSDEVIQTIHAWYAVGVGPDMVFEDLEVVAPEAPMTSSCTYSDKEEITMNILFRRSGCQNVIPAGTELPIGYELNGVTVYDTITLANDLVDGETIEYTFPATEDLSVPDFYDFEFFLNTPIDQNNENNEFGTYTVESIVTHDESALINFNWFVRPPFPLYSVVENEHSTATTSTDAASTGLRGFILTGKDVSQNNITPPVTEEDNFLLNQAYESRICMCVDATAFDSVSVAFDMRQGFAEAYAAVAPDNPNPNLGVAMRLIVDEMPVSQQFHPDTFTNDTIDIDTFVHYLINLDQFAGTSFDLCFQGKHFFDETTDFIGDVGDYTHLDNIELIMKEFVSSANDVEVLENSLEVFPNPAVDQMTMKWSNEIDGDIEVKLVDASGRTVQYLKNIAGNVVEIDLLNVSSGIYFAELITESGRVVKKVLVE